MILYVASGEGLLDRMAIRKATNQETEEISTYSLDVLKEAAMGHVKLSRDKARHMVAPSLSEDGYYLVHIENNVIQGWIGVGVAYDFYSDEIVGVVPEIYVLSPFRKQGIAEKLCKEAFRQLKEKGCNKIQLNVFSGNVSRHLCVKLGFREVLTVMELDLEQ